MAKKIVNDLVLILLFISAVVSLNFFFFLIREGWFFNFQLSTEVNPVDVFSILASTLTTFYVAWFISKKITADRFYTDFLISDLRLIENNFMGFENRIKNSYEDISISTASSDLHSIRLAIERLQSTVDLLNIKTCDCSLLINLHTKLYTKITSSDSSLIERSVRDSHFFSNVCSEFILEIRKLIINANNH
jgi:hypothetical protein